MADLLNLMNLKNKIKTFTFI